MANDPRSGQIGAAIEECELSDLSTCNLAASAIGTVPASALKQPYDLVVVGGGPAGVAGALKGAYLGKRVLIVDKPKAAPPEGGLDPFFSGPTGLFSKALRDAGKTFEVKGLAGIGLDRDVIFQQVRKSCLRLATNNAITSLKLLERFKVDYLQGEATLGSNFDGQSEQQSVAVRLHASPTESVKVDAARVLLCTGSYPRRPADVPFDQQQIFDPDSINAGLAFLPESVVIAGSGIIAIEYAQIFRKLGAEVTMVVRSSADSALARIGLDDTLAERLLNGLRQSGVTILEHTEISSFRYLDEAASACRVETSAASGAHTVRTIAMETNSHGTLEAQLYLGCLGRIPRGRGTSLRLESAGVEMTPRSGHIVVDQGFQTTQRNIYAAGDCVEGPMLASTGVDQAQRACDAMFGCESDMACINRPYPIGMWTTPECAYYGLTQKQALEQGYDAEVGMATYDACLRGRVFAPDGTLKLVFDRETTKILGVHIIGTDACELVHYGMDLVAQGVTIFEVINTLYTAVTFHELFKEAALNGNGKLEFGIEWQDLLRQLGRTMALEDNGSGEIDEAALRARFDEIDTDGEGSLCADELNQLFEREGARLEPSVVPNIIRLVDDDGNGTVEWEEFLKIFRVLHSMQSGRKGGAVAGGAAAKPSREQSSPSVVASSPPATKASPSPPVSMASKVAPARKEVVASSPVAAETEETGAGRAGVSYSPSSRFGRAKPYEAKRDGVSLGHFATSGEAAAAYAGRVTPSPVVAETQDTGAGRAGVSYSPSSRFGRAKPYEAKRDGVSLGHFATSGEAAAAYAGRVTPSPVVAETQNTGAGRAGVSYSPSSRFGRAKPYEAKRDGVSLGHFATSGQAAAAYAGRVTPSPVVAETQDTGAGRAGVSYSPSSRFGRAKPYEAKRDGVSLGHFATSGEAAAAYAGRTDGTSSSAGRAKSFGVQGVVAPTKPDGTAGWRLKKFEAVVSLGFFPTEAEANGKAAQAVQALARADETSLVGAEAKVLKHD